MYFSEGSENTPLHKKFYSREENIIYFNVVTERIANISFKTSLILLFTGKKKATIWEVEGVEYLIYATFFPLALAS